MLNKSLDKSFELEKKEKKKETTDSRYKTLFEQVNAAAFLTTLDGKILEANHKSCELLKYSWDELVTLSLKQIFTDKIDWSQIIDEISAKGGMNFESENIRRDGKHIPVDISTSLFMMDNKPVMLALIWDCSGRKKAEEKLRTSEEKYRSIFDNSAVAIMLTDENEKIISWNRYAETLLDMSEEDLNLRSVETLYPPEEWLKIRSENIREKGMQHHLETRMLKKDNTLLDIDISISILRDNNGKITGSIGVIKDISNQKKTEKKLKESEQEYRGLFESTIDGTIVLDARGEIHDVNSRVLELFGLEKEQVIGNNFLSMDLLTPVSLPVVVKQFGDLLSDRKSQSNETVIKDNNGNELNVEISSFFLVRKDNQIDNFVVIIRDISDRKQAEIKLSREHGLLQTLMDNIPDSIYFKDENNRFIMVNKAKADHSNIAPEDMIGKTDFDFLSEDQAKKAFEDDQEILKTGKFIINKVERLTDKNGIERCISVTKVPRFDAEGDIIGTAGISRDITEMKRLEEEYNQEGSA